jgi:hypothetical protein
VHLLEEDVSELPTFFGQPVPSAEPPPDAAGAAGKPRKKRRSARP